jgi:transcriptional regulator with XRE-family HTH domain
MKSIWEEIRVENVSHPLRSFFKDNGVKLQQIGKYLNTTPQRVSDILRGAVKPGPNTEAKLQELAQRIKEEQ